MADKKYAFAGKLPKMLKRKWLAALRSGDYTQGKFALEDSGRSCCLGVLCRVAEIDSTTHFGSSRVRFDGETNWPSSDSLQKFGLTMSDAKKLARLNDDEDKTFKQIARIIERNIPIQK